MRVGIVALLVPFAASGCMNLGSRDCSSSKISAMGSYTTLLVAEGEGAYDGKRYRPTLTAWKEIAAECRFPQAEVEAIAKALEAADADKTFTKEELAPILKEIDKMVTAMGGPSVGAEAARSPAILVGACEFRESRGFTELPPDIVQDGLEGSRSTAETAKKIDELALSADINLFALAQAEIAHHAKKKSYVTFPKGGMAADWKTLGVTFPAPVRHTFKAVATKAGFDLVAEGNLDNDSFVDRWVLQYDGKDACPRANVLAFDSLNASFEGDSSNGKPYVIVPAGKVQPRIAELP